MEVSEDHECVICKKPIGASPKVILGEKGCSGINKASKERNESLHCTAGQQVHQECHRKYCAPNQMAKAFRQTVQQGVATNTGQQVLRSAEMQFNFSTDCFYCGELATFGRKRKASDVVPVRHNYGSVSRKGGCWANAVQARIYTFTICMLQMQYIIYRVCSANFRTMKQMPAIHEHEDSSLKKEK